MFLLRLNAKSVPELQFDLGVMRAARVRQRDQAARTEREVSQIERLVA